MNSFQLASGISFCNFEIKRNSPLHVGATLGVNLLNIPITFKVHTSPKSRILTTLTGELHLNSQFITELSVSNWGSNIQSSDKNSLEFQINFNSIFTKLNIDAIEKIRNNQDFQFQIKLFGDIFELSSDGKLESNIIHVNGELNHKVLQSEWIDILDKWKYAPAMSFDFVLKFENPSFVKAAEFIYQAQNFYMNGHWPQAVSECRKAIDAITDIVNPKKSTLKSFVDNKHDNNMQERLALSVLAIKQVCDVAGHGDSNATQIKWTQDDALYAIRMTASILMRSSKESM